MDEVGGGPQFPIVGLVKIAGEGVFKRDEFGWGKMMTIAVTVAWFTGRLLGQISI